MWNVVMALATAMALQATWLELPEDWKLMVPAQAVHVMTLLVLALGFLGRLLRQDSPDA